MGYRGKVEERERARELRADGWTLADIAEELSVSKYAVERSRIPYLVLNGWSSEWVTITGPRQMMFLPARTWQSRCAARNVGGANSSLSSKRNVGDDDGFMAGA